MIEKVRVGVVGCGAVSGQCFKMAASFPIVEIVALADLQPERCESRAKEFGLATARICSVEQMMKDKSIECIANLTWPTAHFPITLAAIRAGKHVYSEKPIGVGLAEARKIRAAAMRKGVRVGCAPDTVLGAGVQTARKLVEDGGIGRPVAFTAFMMHRGVETWHPNPPYFYSPGAGPMLDMGPYYLAALLNILGPIKRVGGMASIAIPQRTITHKNKDGSTGPMFGEVLDVATPDHVCGTIEFENGCVGTIVTSFATHFAAHEYNADSSMTQNIYDGRQPITIFGSDGTMKVPDPTRFDGPVHVRKAGESQWQSVSPTFKSGYLRGLGLADLCYAIRTGREHRANIGQAYYAMECLQGILDSSVRGRSIVPTLAYERPAAMPSDLPFGMLDE